MSGSIWPGRPQRRYQLLLIALVLLASPLLFIGGPHYTTAPLYRSLWDAGHIVFFGLLGLLAAHRLSLNSPPQAILASLLAATLGLGIEALQLLTGREFQWQDLVHDLAGFWLGLLAAQTATIRIWCLRAAAFVLAAPLLWTITQNARVHWSATQQFPLINDFETPLDLHRVSGQALADSVRLQTDIVHHGRSALAITLTRTRYSGASLDTLLGDWRGYRHLVMTLYNPGDSMLAMKLRIADRAHNNAYDDRFNQSLSLTPGWNHIALPLATIADAPRDRRMDLSQITDVTLFSVDTTEPQTIIWDHVRLE